MHWLKMNKRWLQKKISWQTLVILQLYLIIACITHPLSETDCKDRKKSVFQTAIGCLFCLFVGKLLFLPFVFFIADLTIKIPSAEIS